MNSAQQGYSTTAATEHQVNHLPFTGIDAGLLVAAGVLFVALGVWTRKLVSAKYPGE